MSLEPGVKRVSRKIPLEDDPDDLVGYEVLIDFIKQRALHKLEDGQRYCQTGEVCPKIW
jgi:hypothetical protein